VVARILSRSGFAGNVVTLMTGTTIAQALPIALSPILTRFYSPEDFGALALYMAICGIISTVATARYELAIMLPKDEESAINIVALAIGMTAAISGLVLVVVTVFNAQLTALLGKKEIGPWLYFVPLSILLTGIYQSLNYWANRRSQYRRMANSRVLQSVGIVTTQCAGGLAGANAGGLIAGSLIGQVFATLQLARMTFRQDRALLRKITNGKCREMALRYINHPKYLVVSHGISSVYGQIPVFFISRFYSLIGTGHFSLAARMVDLPSTLIAAAIGDVFRQRAAEDFNKYGRFDDVFEKTIARTALLGLPFFLGFIFFSEDIFALVFGETWRVAGEYARILAVSSYFGFVFTPIDKGALIREKLGYIFNWHLFRLIAFLMAGILSWYFNLKLTQFLIAITFCNVFFYSLDGFFEYRFSKGL
jgi:O-antigen/teichoic acid export membrane protein